MIKSVIAKLLESSGWLLFVLFSLIFWLFSFAKSELLATDQLFDEYLEAKRQEKYDSDYNDLAAEFEDDIDDFEDEDEYYWSDMVFDSAVDVIYHLVLFALIATALYVGLSSSPDLEGILYKPIFKTVVLAEFVFFLPSIIKLVWFALIATDYDFLTVKNYYPLSLLSLFDPDDVHDWLHYPLRKLNLFEIAYGYVLIMGLSTSLNIPTQKAYKPIILSYGAIVVLFISLQVYISTIL